MALRQRVFVDEQGVPVELERDGRDGEARHAVLLTADGRALATGRLLVLGDTGKLQRIAVERGRRGEGLGRRVMAALEELARDAGCRRVRLSSQVEAMGFYERLGYVAEGETYLDAGILHRDMTRALR
ncbi:MAG: GNAT family N-acetyltransferase [Deltaproteobacteria bacterium]|nr:GNAT family N-acetyltransferase [Deltaproteobacteria bacterium]MCB9787194.1 GNAT family N-acetyltransferase [Deltaproteobacteria bacterium]